MEKCNYCKEPLKDSDEVYYDHYNKLYCCEECLDSAIACDELFRIISKR